MKKLLLLSLLIPFTLVAADKNNYPAPLLLLTKQGGEIVSEFKAPAKMTGYVANFQGQVITLYVTEDEKYLFTGPMIDAQGNNVGEQAEEAYKNGPKAKQDWALLENSHWIRDGSASAKRIIYTFTDPNCPYCKKFWEKARPWVESGAVQIRHIMVGIIKADSLGKAAAIMSAANPEVLFKQFEEGSLASPLQPLKNPAKEISDKLATNYRNMNILGARATPATFYHNQAGELQTQMGLPSDDMMKDIFAPSKAK